MEAPTTAASLLRELRREQGRTLRVAASDLGLAPSQLSRIERGQRGVSDDVGQRIAHYYGISSDLLTLAEGRVPADVSRILLEHPEELDRLRSLYPDEGH